jgi:hypothetical protein
MQPKLRIYPKFKFYKYQVILVIGCIASFVIPALVLKLNLLQNSRVPTWKDAKDNVPQSLVKKALSFDSTGRVDEKSVKVMQIPSQGAGTLYIFDFRSPQLCGINGCVYEVYHETGKLLLQLIANPNLPPKENLIQVANTVHQGFPCLIFTQNTTTENMVSRTLYCYQGERYVRFNQALTTAGVNFTWREGKR